MFPTLALHIDGRWHNSTSNGALSVVNPATGLSVGELPIAGETEIQSAVIAAKNGFRIWSRTLPHDRFGVIRAATDLLRQRADRHAEILTTEQGKPLVESKREILLSADIIEFLAEEAKRLPIRGVPSRAENILSQTVTRVPVGPAAAFTPWNFPVNLPSRKIGAALAAGCSVIIKPAEETPASCMEIVRAFTDAGLPPGVLNLVCGHPAQISGALIQHPDIRKISFTGSVPVGRELGELAARYLKRYTAELGGHAAVIVAPDADAEVVAGLAVSSKYRNAGQVCASPVRFLVHKSRYSLFRDAFVAGAEALRVGSGSDPKSQMGPLISERRVSQMTALVEDAVDAGGRILCGGTRIAGPGSFFSATALEEVPPSARVQQEEPFGPIALLDRYDAVEDAISRANSLPYALAAFAFTHDLALAHRFQDSLLAGMVGINHFGISQPETPFGGVKHSGFGQECGLEGLLAYTDVKLLSVAL